MSFTSDLADKDLIERSTNGEATVVLVGTAFHIKNSSYNGSVQQADDGYTIYAAASNAKSAYGL